MCTVWAALFLFLSPFSFRYRFAALLRTPSPHTHPSLLSICPFPRLSTAFPFSSLPPFNAPRVVTLVLSRLSVFVRPSPARRVPFLLLSLRLSRSRFFSCFFHRPPSSSRFFLSLMPRLLSSFRSSTTTDSSLLTPSSRAAFYLPPSFVPLYIPPPPP